MRAWAGVGEAYADSYAALCAGTTDAIAAALGEPYGRSVLDVGSGTGDLAASLATRGWSVTACDPEPSMRAVAQRVHPSLTVVDGALPTLPFADAVFDAVTANFVLNHVSDPRAAARELARVAAPGAALVATIWLQSPSWFWAGVCDRAGLVPHAGARLDADKEFERTPEGFAAMLSVGGWIAPEASELSWVWQATPAALWASAEGGVASAGAFFLALSHADRARFRNAFEQLCAEHESGGFVALDHTAAVAIGRAD